MGSVRTPLLILSLISLLSWSIILLLLGLLLVFLLWSSLSICNDTIERWTDSNHNEDVSPQKLRPLDDQAQAHLSGPVPHHVLDDKTVKLYRHTYGSMYGMWCTRNVCPDPVWKPVYSPCPAPAAPAACWTRDDAQFGWHYSSKATCLIWPHLFYALFVVSRITMNCYTIRHFWRTHALNK